MQNFVDLIIGINFHPFHRSTPLLKSLKALKVYLLEHQIIVRLLCWFSHSPAQMQSYI